MLYFIYICMYICTKENRVSISSKDVKWINEINFNVRIRVHINIYIHNNNVGGGK